MVKPTAFYRNDRGASAVEFALVLPLLILCLFGIIDGGRFLWESNQAEKATQAGARFAVVTAPVASGISTQGFVGVSGLTQGDRIPASALPTVTCDSSNCGPDPCTGCPAGIPGTYDATAFANIVARMNALDPKIAAANVLVKYSGSGLGFAGDPNGAEVSPLVTVQLTGLQFTPITSLLFQSITMPIASTTLTAEDLSGDQSN